MAIKAEVFNHFRSQIYALTDGFRADKVKEVNKILEGTRFSMFVQKMADAHAVLNNLKAKRKTKAVVEAARVARGYKPKKKTSKADYEASCKEPRLSAAD